MGNFPLIYSEKTGNNANFRTYTHLDLIEYPTPLTEVVNALNNPTKAHSHRVTWLVRKTAENVAKEFHCDNEFLEDVYIAASYHDIGKVVMETIVLNHQELSEKGWEQIHNHPLYSAIILSKNPPFNKKGIIKMIIQHHENNDGSGYLFKITGKEMSLGAKIISICDDYDASTDPSPMRDYNNLVLSVEDFEEVIRNDNGREYDPKIARIFLEDVLSDVEFLRKLNPNIRIK